MILVIVHAPRWNFPWIKLVCASGLGSLLGLHLHQPFGRRPIPFDQAGSVGGDPGQVVAQGGKAFYPFKFPSEGGKNDTDISMDHLD